MVDIKLLGTKDRASFPGVTKESVDKSNEPKTEPLLAFPPFAGPSESRLDTSIPKSGPNSLVAARTAARKPQWVPKMDPALATKFPTLGEIPPEFIIDPKDNQACYVLDGKVVPWKGKTREVQSKIGVFVEGGLTPVTLGTEALLDAAEVEKIVRSAAEAADPISGVWRNMTTDQRTGCVKQFADGLEANKDKIARLLTWELCTPHADALDEVERTVAAIRKAMEIWPELEKPTFRQSETAGRTEISREPIGAILFQPPFNYPINESLVDIARALLAGNTAVLHPSRIGQLSLQRLFPLMASCFPKGVFSAIPGDRSVIAEAMRLHKIDRQGLPRAYISELFWVGGDVGANAAVSACPLPAALRVVTHTAAKNPAIILEGAEPQKVAPEIVTGAFSKNGKRCTREDTVFVHRSVAKPMVSEIGKCVNALKVGMPFENGAKSTPDPEDNKVPEMQANIQDAVNRGAYVINHKGGQSFSTLMRPAVLYPCTLDMAVTKFEQFGKILSVVVYDDINEVYQYMRDSGYGQQVSIWGPKDAVRRVARCCKRFVQTANPNRRCKRHDDVPFGGKFHNGYVSETDSFDMFTRIVAMPEDGS